MTHYVEQVDADGVLSYQTEPEGEFTLYSPDELWLMLANYPVGSVFDPETLDDRALTVMLIEARRAHGSEPLIAMA